MLLVPWVFVAVEVTEPRLTLDPVPAVTLQALVMVSRTWKVAVAGLAALAVTAIPLAKSNAAASLIVFMYTSVVLKKLVANCDADTPVKAYALTCAALKSVPIV
jgi:redox-regulated HSP33 family molecular chaperone